MNILVLMGSPRQNGKSNTMAKVFEEAAIKEGHDVTFIDVAKKDVHPCLACEYCHSHDGVCVQKDDMAEILEAIKAADCIAIASPIYYFTMSAQMQLVLQRMYPINVPEKLKKVVLMLGSYSANVYSGAIAEVRDICSYSGAELAAVIVANDTDHGVEGAVERIQQVVKGL